MALTPIDLVKGWNLVGNSDSTSIDVAKRLNSPLITTVWKWNKLTSKWVFYTPTMTSAQLTTYAQSKDYEVLTHIDPKEGFWINANEAHVLSDLVTQPGTAVTLATSDLISGWNLLASADQKTPAQLSGVLAGNLNAAAINTLWAWDAQSLRWKFFAPSLDAQGGTIMADYIREKGYLSFFQAITPTEGFWLNLAVTPPSNATNTLFLADNTLIFDDYYLKTPYTLTQFQSQPGIIVKWPIYDAAAIKFTLADAGSFNVAAGQTISAAVSISDTAPGSQGIVKLYIDNIAITKNGSNITFTVPSPAVAWVYGMAVDGNGAGLKNFSSTVSNASSTLSIAPNIASRIEIGSTIKSAINSVGSLGSMIGTYKVTFVLTNLPLSQANGTAFKSYTIEIPKSLGDMSNVRTITGLGLEGFITLQPW